MASLPFLTHMLPLPRCHLNMSFYSLMNNGQLQDLRVQTRWSLKAVSKKKVTESLAQDVSTEEQEASIEKTTRTSKGPSKRGRKKAVPETPEENSAIAVDNTVIVTSEESISASVSSEDSKKTARRARRKSAASATSTEEEKINKVIKRRKTTKKVDDAEDQSSDAELSDNEGDKFIENAVYESEDDMELEKYSGDDISFSYSWPPLVCCFGAAQHAFVPCGRPANRLINYEIHEQMSDALWAPEKFVRAPGGSSSSVAVALASLGGRVAFMGKLGDDEYGETMLYYLNMNNVQTRSVRVDSKRLTAISQMKIAKRGGLRMTCVKPCAEDCLSKSEINIDVLKEAKMFYFNTSSLLDRSMRSTTLQAIKISKKLGGVIFYDLNLPLPLWQSDEETKQFIQAAWNLADVIEVTKQELEFLCGIKPDESFDTKNNDKSKFVHYKSEVVAPIWHEELKVLFVTNGTSKIHYYTKEHDGSVHGMEDAPITPFTCDMSASGDGIVAALIRMLTVQPHLITDKEYLEHAIKYAIDCGVIDQWLLGRQRGFPPREDMDDEEWAADPNGIKSLTQMEFLTFESVS